MDAFTSRAQHRRQRMLRISETMNSFHIASLWSWAPFLHSSPWRTLPHLGHINLGGMSKPIVCKCSVQVSFWELIGNTLEDFTIVVLIISGVTSIGLELAFGDRENGWIEGAAILAAVAVVSLVTALNDYEKEQQFRQLSALSSDIQVTVVRNGEAQEINTSEAVVGDVMLLNTGDILPADGLLFEGNDIRRASSS